MGDQRPGRNPKGREEREEWVNSEGQDRGSSLLRKTQSVLLDPLR